MCRELRIQIEELKAENADIQHLRNRVAGLHQQLEFVCKSRDEAQQAMSRAAEIHANLQDSMAKCNAELGGKREEIRLLQLQIQSLKEELGRQRAELDRLQSLVCEKGSVILQLRDSKKIEVEQCERRIDELEAQLSTHKALAHHLTSKGVSMANSTKDLVADIENISKESEHKDLIIKELHKQVQEARDQVSRWKVEISQVEENARSAIAAEQQACAQRDQALHQLNSERAAQHPPSPTAIVQASPSVRETIELGGLRQELAEARRLLAETETARAGLSAEYIQLQHTYEALNVDYGDLKGRYTGLETEHKSRISDLSKQLESHQHNVEDIRSTFGAAVTKLEGVRDELHSELAAAQKRVTEESKECGLLRNKLASGSSSSIPADKKKAAEMWEQKLSDIDALASQVAHLTKVNAVLVARNKELEGLDEEGEEEEETDKDEESEETEDELSEVFQRLERNRSRPPPAESRN
jgi:chromosome segregation ATPase